MPKGIVLSRSEMQVEAERLRKIPSRMVFTNGCFDILHVGHVRYLEQAAAKGDVLIVGLNSDASMKRYKGETRPIVPESERAEMLAALDCVDYVVIFEEDEPRDLIAEIVPDVLVKGGEWAHYVSGRDVVEANGGCVWLAPMVEGKSTTNIIQTILDRLHECKCNCGGFLLQTFSRTNRLG